MLGLLATDRTEVKGKTVILFVPVEINRQIIPYNFKIEITDAVKETSIG